MTPKKKAPTKPTNTPVPDPDPAPKPTPGERFTVRGLATNFQVIDSTNGYVHAVSGSQDEAESMALSLNENPPEESSATD